MKKVILGLAFSIVCAFGLEKEQMIVEFSNGMMLGVCAAGEQAIANMRINNGMDAKTAAEFWAKAFKVCNEAILPLQPTKKSYKNKKELQAADTIFNGGIKTGKEKATEIIEYAMDELDYISKISK